MLAAVTGALVAFILIDVHDTAVADCRQVQGLVLANRQAILLRRESIDQPGSATAHYSTMEKLRARQLADRQLALYAPRRCR